MYHYYMFNKPYGCVCARRDDKHPTVMDYFKNLNNPNLSPVGRLDRETEGLLIITDDGKWNQLMTHPSNNKEKLYEFIVFGNLTADSINRLENGIDLIGSDRLTSPAKVTVTNTAILSEIVHTLHPEIQKNVENNLKDTPVTYGTISITEGRKRQVRRMMKAVGCYVIYLKRISMGDICLDENLKPGEWKELSSMKQ